MAEFCFFMAGAVTGALVTIAGGIVWVVVELGKDTKGY